MDAVDRARGLNLDEPPLAGRARFLAAADRSVIPSVQCGVLFIVAFWSVSSYQSLARLKEVLTRLDPEGRLEIVVVDIDGSEDLVRAPEFLGKVHGNGEAAWISRGWVVATAACASHPKAFETYTRSLLAECG